MNVEDSLWRPAQPWTPEPEPDTPWVPAPTRMPTPTSPLVPAPTRTPTATPPLAPIPTRTPTPTPPLVPAPARTPATTSAHHRVSALDGLRALAVVAVLLYHGGFPWARGGFLGVDVFFVLSGFLITGLLVTERERTGRIGLGAFYARRARRILPAAVVVLAATLLAAPLVLSPLDLRRIGDDGLAASLSLANMRYVVDATDYFAPVNASPMLNFWSWPSRSSSTSCGRSCC